MTTDVAIRLAVPADARRIAELSRDLIETGLPWGWRAGRIAAAIGAAETNVAVVGAVGRPEAFGIMHYRDDDAYLALLAVTPALQRRGVGSALLCWLEASARAAGLSRIRVEARRDNLAARAFYNEHGFHERVIAQGHYSRFVDGIRLEKWLRPDGDAAPG